MVARSKLINKHVAKALGFKSVKALSYAYKELNQDLHSYKDYEESIARLFKAFNMSPEGIIEISGANIKSVNREFNYKNDKSKADEIMQLLKCKYSINDNSIYPITDWNNFAKSPYEDNCILNWCNANSNRMVNDWNNFAKSEEVSYINNYYRNPRDFVSLWERDSELVIKIISKSRIKKFNVDSILNRHIWCLSHESIIKKEMAIKIDEWISSRSDDPGSDISKMIISYLLG